MGLEIPYFKDLQNIKFMKEEGSTSLVETIYAQQSKHANSFPKKYLKQSYVFGIAFVFVLIFLAIFIYWPLIEKILPSILKMNNSFS
jgi:hypothetical protein